MEIFNREAVSSAYDVIVAGGGSAGSAAAIAATRHGLKTLLLEGTGCAGGTATAGALPFWLGAMTGSIPFPQMVAKGLRYQDLPRPRRAVGGIFLEAVERLKMSGHGTGPSILAQTGRYPGLDRLGCHDEFTFDLEAGKRILDEIFVEADVDVRYYTTAIDVKRQGDKIHGVFFVNKSGLQYASAGVVIDCTGDADLVARGGFATWKGSRETGEMTAASLVAHLENINAGAIEAYLNNGGDPWFRDICRQAIQDHPGLDLPTGLIIFPMVQEGVFMVNGGTSFGGYDGTSGMDLTALTMRGRQRANLLVESLFRPYMPGGADCRLRLTAAYPGIRETRRIVAEYILTEADLLSGKRFSDTIALAGRHFDLSHGGRQPFAEAGLSVKNGVAPIPFRSLIPQGADNILAAGRCIAAEGQALGPARIMSTCFATGEAAGTAAWLKLKSGCAFRNLSIEDLRGSLRAQGAEIDD